MPNLVSPTCPCLQILDKTQTGVFQISGFLVNSLLKNCHKSRISIDIDMKFDIVTKRDEKTKTSKKKTMTSCRKIMTSLSSSLFMADLKQSGSRIPDAWFIILTFSLIATFQKLLTKIRGKPQALSSSFLAFLVVSKSSYMNTISNSENLYARHFVCL